MYSKFVVRQSFFNKLFINRHQVNLNEIKRIERGSLSINFFHSTRRSTNRNDNKDDKLHPIFEEESSKASAKKPSFETDPYPIPFQHPKNLNPISSSSNENSSKSDNDSFSSFVDDYKSKSNDYDRETFRSRLVYQSRKRGIVEVELLLGSFIKANNNLKDWDHDQLKQYDRFLDLPDWDIYYYLTKKKEPVEGSEFKNSNLLNSLRTHTSNSNKQIRKMPEIF